MRNANKYTYREEWSEEDGVYIARCLEFPSLAAHGPTPEEAFKEIREVFVFLRHVHKEVSMRAAGEGVSINSYIVSCLS